MTTALPHPPLLRQGVVAALVGAGLLGLAAAGDVPLLVGVLLLQLLTALGFLALVDAPASGGVFGLAVAATIAADVTVLADDGKVGGLAAVVAVTLVAGLLHQLSRRERARVTESLADTFVCVVLACSSACLLAAQVREGGTWPLRTALAAGAVAVLAGRVGDAVVRRPALVHGSTRAWPGLLLGLGSAVAVAVTVSADHLVSGRAALLGLAAGATVASVDLAIDLCAAELTPDSQDSRRVAALRPVLTLLPYVVLGPVVLTAVLLLEST